MLIINYDLTLVNIRQLFVGKDFFFSFNEIHWCHAIIQVIQANLMSNSIIFNGANNGNYYLDIASKPKQTAFNFTVNDVK